MRWKPGKTKYYIASDAGYKISKIGDEKNTVYTAWPPRKPIPREGHYDWEKHIPEAIGYFKGKDAYEKAK